MTIPDDLIPDNIRKMIRDANGWEDGDIWMLGNGRKAEFDQEKMMFTITEKGEVIGMVPFKTMMEREKK